MCSSSKALCTQYVNSELQDSVKQLKARLFFRWGVSIKKVCLRLRENDSLNSYFLPRIETNCLTASYLWDYNFFTKWLEFDRFWQNGASDWKCVNLPLSCCSLEFGRSVPSIWICLTTIWGAAQAELQFTLRMRFLSYKMEFYNFLWGRGFPRIRKNFLLGNFILWWPK